MRFFLALLISVLGAPLPAVAQAPSGGTPEQFAAYIRSEIVKWARVIKESGARAE